MNEIVCPLSIPEVIDAYNDAKKRIEFHLDEIEAIKRRLRSLGVADLSVRPEINKFETLADLKRKTWRTLLNVSGAEKVLSVKRMDEFERMLSSDFSVQEPTQEAIMELLINGNIKELFNEMLEETYKFLRPGANLRNHLKTNDKNARSHVGEKIILTNVFWGNNYFWMNDVARAHLAATDKLFHLLDKKPYNYNTYSSPLVDTMEKNSTGETEYFRWIRYQNGNLHLFFKRKDLLQLFNQMAGQLKPALC